MILMEFQHGINVILLSGYHALFFIFFNSPVIMKHYEFFTTFPQNFTNK